MLDAPPASVGDSGGEHTAWGPLGGLLGRGCGRGARVTVPVLNEVLGLAHDAHNGKKGLILEAPPP